MSFAGISFFALLIYDKNRTYIGIAFSILILFIAFSVSVLTFVFIYRKGILSAITSLYSAPEFDIPDSKSKIEIEKLDMLFSSENKPVKIAFLEFWGHNPNKISQSEVKSYLHLPHKNLVRITFENEAYCEIISPSDIYLTAQFIRIENADKIRWRNHINSIEYRKQGKKISTTSKSKWLDLGFDISSMKAAVYIQLRND